MDRLTELFASKPTSYLGLGIVYNGDTRGNGVTSTEHGVEVIPRFNQSDGGGGTHPFKCPARSGNNSVVEGGTVNGISATNLTLNISTSGTAEVYLDVTYTRSLSANSYVLGFSGAITCAIGTGGSVPSDSNTHLYRRLATYVSGVQTLQAVTTSMEVAVRDDGTGTGTPRAIWTQA